MMKCPICDAAMTVFWKSDALHVLKCANGGCRFICLDPETWESPHCDKDYYGQVDRNDVNPARSFIRKRAHVIAKHCTRGGRLAELGCGLGETAVALSKIGFDVWGVEESQNAVAFLRETYPAVHWVRDRIEAFLSRAPHSEGPANDRFHVITMFHVLEHIPRPQLLIPRLKDSLMPEGFLVIEVPDVHGGLARLRGRAWEYWLKHHVNYFSMVSLRRLLEPCGFRLVHAERMFHFGYPQGVVWKDTVRGALAYLGMNSIIRTIWQLR